MPLITPRRRFLITAPLALLLPAGLLTYLGLELVNLVDKRYEERAEEIVDRIGYSVRNRGREELYRQVLSTFRDTTVQSIEEWSQTPGELQTQPLPFVESILIYKEGDLHAYEPEEDSSAPHTRWRYSPPRQNLFTERLQAVLQVDTSQFDTPVGYIPTLYGFFNLIYPDRFRGQQPPEEMAFYSFIHTTDWDFRQPPPASIKAVGFTVDVEAMTDSIFQTLIDRMWQFRDDLPYPIAIYTHDGLRCIARPAIPENGFVPSTRYNPRVFDNRFFPWLQVHYSAQTGADFIRAASNEKLFYYLLILTANLCLIAAVLGALRDIARELQLSDMRSNFVARVSHELRTPLGLIRLFAETLELGRVEDQNKRNEYLHAITKESERLTNLINNILNFSQIEANTMRYSFQPHSIEDLIADSMDTMHYHFKRHDFETSVDMEPDLPELWIDAEAIQQVLYNLFSNAVKYGAKGQWLGVRVYRHHRCVRIEVSDRGFGIPHEHQERIFQEFYRVDDPQVRETGGSGLGLAVVRHIVHAHHGKISIRSTPGEGSTFVVELPVQEAGRKEHSG